MAKHTFGAEICDLALSEAAESFEDEVNLTNKEQEAKTVDLYSLWFLVAACKIVNFASVWIVRSSYPTDEKGA